MDIDDGGGGLLVDREWREGMLPGTDSTDWDSNPELREIFEAISKDPLQSRSTLSTEPFFLDADEHKSLEPGASGNRKFERPDINQFLRDLGRNLGVASVVGYQDFPYTEGGAARADPFVEREYWLKLSIPGLGGTDGYAILHVHYMGKFYDPNQCAFTGARSTITQINIRHTWNSSQDVSERYNMKCADLDKWRERKGNVVLGPKEAPHGWKWREDSQRKKTWFTSSLRDLLEKGEKCTTVVRKKYVEYMQGAAAVSSRTTFSRSKPLFEEGVRDAGWSGLRLAALCIGVGTYSGSLKLDNPVRDAEALFEAINKFPDCRAAILRDPQDRSTMTDHLCDEFLEKLKALSADKLPEVVALVLAGHGMQHESNVFLIPAKAKCDSERKLKDNCLSHTSVLEYMLDVLDSPARKALKEVKFVVIMDMCRVPGEFDLTKTISEPDQNKAPGCWSICYSTSRGSVAADGAPGSHSPLVLGLLDPQSGIFAPGVSLKEGIEHACSVVEKQSGVDTRQCPTDMKLRRLGDFILQPTPVINRAEGKKRADNPQEDAVAAAKKQRCEGPKEPTSSGLPGASGGKSTDPKSVDDNVTKRPRLEEPHAGGGGGGGGGGGQGQGSGGGCAASSDSTQQAFPFDVFISHAWDKDDEGRDNHERATRLNTGLKRLGMKICFDDDQRQGDILDCMTRGIKSSAIVLICVTRRYAEKVTREGDNNCKLEFDFAYMKRTSVFMLPVVMEESMTDKSEWGDRLLAVLGFRSYHKLTSDVDVEFDKAVRDIAAAVRTKIDERLLPDLQQATSRKVQDAASSREASPTPSTHSGRSTPPQTPKQEVALVYIERLVTGFKDDMTNFIEVFLENPSDQSAPRKWKLCELLLVKFMRDKVAPSCDAEMVENLSFWQVKCQDSESDVIAVFNEMMLDLKNDSKDPKKFIEMFDELGYEFAETTKQNHTSIFVIDWMVQHRDSPWVLPGVSWRKEWKKTVVLQWFDDNNAETSDDFLKRAEDFLQKGVKGEKWGIKILGKVIETNSYVAFFRMEALAALLLREYCSQQMILHEHQQKQHATQENDDQKRQCSLPLAISLIVSSCNWHVSFSKGKGPSTACVSEMAWHLQRIACLPAKTLETNEYSFSQLEFVESEPLYDLKAKSAISQGDSRIPINREKEGNVRRIYNDEVAHTAITKYLEDLREAWGSYIDSASGERRRIDGSLSLLLFKSTSFHSICDSDGATTQEDLICPISREFLQDPVECSDGHTYERNDIEKHFKLALDRGKPCNSPMSRQILDAQKGDLRILWCESKGYGDARQVWCQPNEAILEKIKKFKEEKEAELENLKQRAEGEEERRIFHSRLGYWHDGGSKGGAKTNKGKHFGSAEKFLEKFLAETRLACLTGPPASGKTVTMQQLVCAHVAISLDRLQEQKDLPLLPVFIRAAELPKLLAGNTNSVENMRELVAIFINAKVDQEIFDIGVRTQILELFDNDHVLMCIDGLDEAAQHQDLVERIIDGAVKEKRSLHILLSTREHSYRHSRGCLRLGAFDVVNLQPLDERRQRAMIEDRLSTDQVGTFLEQLQSVAGKNPELATSPFLLSLILEVYKKDGVIPTRRVELYAKQVEAIVLRCIHKQMHGQGGVAADADALEVCTDYLGALAFVCQMRLEKRDFTLAACARDVQELWHHAPDLLTRARELMFGNPIVGLLTVVGDNVYRFSHLTLQEYLAAKCTVRLFGHDAKELLNQLQPLHSHWKRMVLQFTACMLSEQVFEGFCQLVLASDDGTGSHCELVQDFLQERGASEKVERMVRDKLQEIRGSEGLIAGLCHPSAELRHIVLSEMKKFGVPPDPFAETDGTAAALRQIAEDGASKWHTRAAALLSLVQMAQMDHCRKGNGRSDTLQWLLGMLNGEQADQDQDEDEDEFESDDDDEDENENEDEDEDVDVFEIDDDDDDQSENDDEDESEDEDEDESEDDDDDDDCIRFALVSGLGTLLKGFEQTDTKDEIMLVSAEDEPLLLRALKQSANRVVVEAVADSKAYSDGLMDWVSKESSLIAEGVWPMRHLLHVFCFKTATSGNQGRAEKLGQQLFGRVHAVSEDVFQGEQDDVLKGLNMICPAMSDDRLPLFLNLLQSGEVKQRSRVMQVAAELGMQFVSKSRESLDTLAQALLSGVAEGCTLADLMEGGSLLAALLRDESNRKHKSLRDSSNFFVYLMESFGPAALRHRSEKCIGFFLAKRVVDFLVEFEKHHLAAAAPAAAAAAAAEKTEEAEKRYKTQTSKENQQRNKEHRMKIEEEEEENNEKSDDEGMTEEEGMTDGYEDERDMIEPQSNMNEQGGEPENMSGTVLAGVVEKFSPKDLNHIPIRPGERSLPLYCTARLWAASGLMQTSEKAIAGWLSLSLSKLQEYEKRFEGLRRPWMTAQSPKYVQWEEYISEIMQHETRCLGRFYFTIFLEYIRERQSGMNDISELEQIEAHVKQWQPSGASGRIEQQLLLKELAIGRRVEVLPSWAGVVSDSIQDIRLPKIVQDAYDNIYPEQKCVAQRLLERVKYVMNSPVHGDHPKGGLQGFDDIGFLVLVPPFNTLKSQTEKRIEDCLSPVSPPWNSHVLTYDNSISSKFKKFKEAVLEKPKSIFVLIADDSHWGYNKDGAHDKFVNDADLLKATNLVIIQVSATPYCNLTRHSRVPEKYIEDTSQSSWKIISPDEKRQEIGAYEELHVVNWYPSTGNGTKSSSGNSKYLRLEYFLRSIPSFERHYYSLMDGTFDVDRPLSSQYIRKDAWFELLRKSINRKREHLQPQAEQPQPEHLWLADMIMSLVYFRYYRWNASEFKLFRLEESRERVLYPSGEDPPLQMWWDSGDDSLSKKIFDSKLAEDDGKSDELRVLKEKTVFFPDDNRPADSEKSPCVKEFLHKFREMCDNKRFPELKEASERVISGVVSEVGTFIFADETHFQEQNLPEGEKSAFSVFLYGKLDLENLQLASELECLTESDRMVLNLLEATSWEARECPHNKSNASKRVWCVSGPMKVVRVMSNEHGAMASDVLKDCCRHLFSELSDKSVHPLPFPPTPFAIMKDFGQPDAMWCNLDDHFRTVHLIQKGSDCLPKLHDFVLKKDSEGKPLDSGLLNPKQLEYGHLEGLPCLLILVEKGRMGDTFPHSFNCLDLRIRTSENTTTFVQEIGRLCRYPSTLPIPGLSNDKENFFSKWDEVELQLFKEKRDPFEGGSKVLAVSYVAAEDKQLFLGYATHKMPWEERANGRILFQKEPYTVETCEYSESNNQTTLTLAATLPDTLVHSLLVGCRMAPVITKSMVDRGIFNREFFNIIAYEQGSHTFTLKGDCTQHFEIHSSVVVVRDESCLEWLVDEALKKWPIKPKCIIEEVAYSFPHALVTDTTMKKLKEAVKKADNHFPRQIWECIKLKDLDKYVSPVKSKQQAKDLITTDKSLIHEYRTTYNGNKGSQRVHRFTNANADAYEGDEYVQKGRSVELGNVHLRRFVLSAESQIGKTGAYCWFLKLLADEIRKGERARERVTAAGTRGREDGGEETKEEQEEMSRAGKRKGGTKNAKADESDDDAPLGSKMAGIARSRLIEERKSWRLDHPLGFFARLDTKPDGTQELMRWKCGIPGKEGTIWANGLFRLTMEFSEDYPHKPPKCKFPQGFFHPNIYPSGTVCLSILNEEEAWKPDISIKQILLDVQDLLDSPNPLSPAQEDASRIFMQNKTEYERRVITQVRQHRPEVLLGAA